MDSNCIEVVAWVSLSTIPPLMLSSIIRPLLAVEVSDQKVQQPMSLPSSRDPKELIFSFYHGHWFCVYPGTKKSCSDTTTSTYQHNSIVISALPKLLKPFDILAFNVLSILLTVLSPPDSTKYLRMNLITACKIHITIWIVKEPYYLNYGIKNMCKTKDINTLNCGGKKKILHTEKRFSKCSWDCECLLTKQSSNVDM